jgi:hypothetical protein
MAFSESRSETVPVQLPNGSLIKVEATVSIRNKLLFSLHKSLYCCHHNLDSGMIYRFF